VSALEAPIAVKVFISPDMPPPFHTLSQQLSDLLNDYEAHSKGMLTYQIISPANDDEEAEEAARGFGIEKVGIGQKTEDEVSLRAVYKGIAFVQGENTEVIKDLRTTGNPAADNFEYEFTRALLNLQDVEPRVVAFVGGFGGPASDPQFTQGVQPVFQQLYGDLIKVEVVDFSAPKVEIAENIGGLVLLNIDQPVSDTAKFAIDQFVQRGGSLGWFQSAAVPDQQIRQQLMQQMGGQGQIPDIRRPAGTGLEELFAKYGVDYNGDVILDRQNALALGFVMTQRGLARVSHPATYLMSEIDRTLPFTANIPALAMPAPSSVTIRPEAREREGVDVYELVKTADVSVRRVQPPTSMGYKEFVEPEEGEQPGPFVVAAAIQGDVPSLFEDKPIPEGYTEADVAKEANPSRILVVGSGEFFQPRPDVGFNEQLAGMGGQFLLSSIEWLVQDNALTQIRGKNMPRLIGEVPRDLQRSIQMVNIAFVPALFLALGWFVRLYRRRRRETFKL
jgi:ABC-type uncharacterized transport system involved in gliding motility auxiliary subunit